MDGAARSLGFATKGELAIQILREAYADGLDIDFACGDEVYGSCPVLRRYLEDRGQGYVLRVPKTFTVALGGGITLICATAVNAHLKARARWQVIFAGTGSKGEPDYAWAWMVTASPRRWLLIRRHLATGQCAYHYRHVPAGQPASLPTGIRMSSRKTTCQKLNQGRSPPIPSMSASIERCQERPAASCRHPFPL